MAVARLQVLGKCHGQRVAVDLHCLSVIKTCSERRTLLESDFRIWRARQLSGLHSRWVCRRRARARF